MPRLIAIEGIDGAGKGTQAGRLLQRLQAAGYSVRLFSFPRYSQTLFGKAIGQYLNGRFGSLAEVHPFLVSLLFAGDRLESKAELLDALQSCDIVLCDRYVPSNIAHQASKRTGAERAALIDQIESIEYGVYGLPRPDLVLLLDLPLATSQQLIAKKAARDYTDKKADLQEADGDYLGQVLALYHELAARSAEWRLVPCCRDGKLQSVDAIAEAVFDVVQPLLPARG